MASKIKVNCINCGNSLNKNTVKNFLLKNHNQLYKCSHCSFYNCLNVNKQNIKKIKVGLMLFN